MERLLLALKAIYRHSADLPQEISLSALRQALTIPMRYHFWLKPILRRPFTSHLHSVDDLRWVIKRHEVQLIQKRNFSLTKLSTEILHYWFFGSGTIWCVPITRRDEERAERDQSRQWFFPLGIKIWIRKFNLRLFLQWKITWHPVLSGRWILSAAYLATLALTSWARMDRGNGSIRKKNRKWIERSNCWV